MKCSRFVRSTDNAWSAGVLRSRGSLVGGRPAPTLRVQRSARGGVGARPPRASGVPPARARQTGPAGKASNPRLSPRGADRAVGGIRAWTERPGRRASYTNLLPAVRRDIRMAYRVLCEEPATRVSQSLVRTGKCVSPGCVGSDRSRGHAFAAILEGTRLHEALVSGLVRPLAWRRGPRGSRRASRHWEGSVASTRVALRGR